MFGMQLVFSLEVKVSSIMICFVLTLLYRNVSLNILIVKSSIKIMKYIGKRHFSFFFKLNINKNF